MLNCFCFSPLAYAPDAACSARDTAVKAGCVLDFPDSKSLKYVSPCQTPWGGCPSPGLSSCSFPEKAKNCSGSRERVWDGENDLWWYLKGIKLSPELLGLERKPRAIKCQDYLSAIRADVEGMHFLSAIYINHFCFFVLMMLWYMEAFCMGRDCSCWGQLIPRDSKQLAIFDV